MELKRLFAVGLAALVPLVGIAADRYKIIDLSSPSFSVGEVLAINDVGMVTFGGFNKAYIWQNGVYTQVFGPPQNQLRTIAINNLGVIAGYCSNSGTTGGVWQTPAAFEPIVAEGVCHGINDAGTVVGQRSVGGSTLGFKWANGVLTPLSTLGGNSCSGRAINSLGQIAGWAYNPISQRHAVRYDGNTITDLGNSPGYNDGYPVAMNDLGDVVGLQSTDATVWLNGGPITLVGNLPDYFESTAEDINNARQVVGYQRGNLGVTAYLWDNGILHQLNTLAPTSGWNLRTAKGINNNGWIVGTGTLNGVDKPFLAIPTLEIVPTSFVCNKGLLLASGLSDLLFSDDQRLRVITNSRALVNQVDVTGTTNAASVTRLDIDVETSSNGSGTNLKIYAYDFVGQSWVQLDSCIISGTDSTRSLSISSNVARFLSNGEVKVRVEFKAASASMRAVTTSIDQVHWTLFP